MNLCRQRDRFIEDQVIWVVDLSNGETIFQDDAREDCDPPSAWLRLTEYVKQENLKITRMRLRYWDNIVFLPDGADGYYFSKGASFDSVSGISGEFYNAGTLEGEEVKVYKYSIPELIRIGKEKVVKADNAGVFLIRN